MSLLACAGAGLAAGPARANQAVVMRNGSHLEVTRAVEDGDTMRLELPGGGTLSVARADVKRLSVAAEDMPSHDVAAVRSGSGYGSGSGSVASASGGGIEVGGGFGYQGGAMSSSRSAQRNVKGVVSEMDFRGHGSEATARGRTPIRTLETGVASPVAQVAAISDSPAIRRNAALEASFRPTPENMRRMMSRTSSGGGNREMALGHEGSGLVGLRSAGGMR